MNYQLPQKDNQSMSLDDPTPSPIPHGYSITSYTLIIEHRHCDTCQSIHESPAHNLRVSLIHYRTKATRTISLPDLNKFYNTLPSQIKQEFKNPVLPRRIHNLHTDVPFCQSCFHPTEEDQLDFFDNKDKILTPMQVAHFRSVSQQLAEEYGRQPTAKELKDAAKKRTPQPTSQPKTAKILDLTQFL